MERKLRVFTLCLMIAILAFVVGIGLAHAGDKELEISWLHNAEEDLAGYLLVIENGDGVALLPVITIPFDIANPAPPVLDKIVTVADGEVTTVCAKMSAFDFAANDSGFTVPVCIDVDFDTPGLPASVTIKVKAVSP